jgi:type II pantothenate kinase
MEDSQLPTSVGTSLLIDLTGAQIVSSAEGDLQETDEIYLPRHNELISHIALDVSWHFFFA